MRKLGLAALLLLAGCGSEGAAATDSTKFVCDDFATFVRDGKPADKRSEVVSDIGELIGNADEKVRGAYDTLTNTVNTPTAQPLADDTFAQACFDAGWEG